MRTQVVYNRKAEITIYTMELNLKGTLYTVFDAFYESSERHVIRHTKIQLILKSTFGLRFQLYLSAAKPRNPGPAV